jgi:hypothetical protein
MIAACQVPASHQLLWETDKDGNRLQVLRVFAHALLHTGALIWSGYCGVNPLVSLFVIMWGLAFRV